MFPSSGAPGLFHICASPWDVCLLPAPVGAEELVRGQKVRRTLRPHETCLMRSSLLEVFSDLLLCCCSRLKGAQQPTEPLRQLTQPQRRCISNKVLAMPGVSAESLVQVARVAVQCCQLTKSFEPEQE